MAETDRRPLHQAEPSSPRRWWSRRKADPDPLISFVCNICNTPSTVSRPTMSRETVSCPGCHSILRWRSIIAALSVARYGRSLPLAEFPVDTDVVGLGMSDWRGYADRLAQVFAYRNTFYDEEPLFDVMAPVPDELAGSYDFILTSDVLEHVPPPFGVALTHLRMLLKPGGLLVLTVPIRPDGPIEEHYPDLHQYEIVPLGDRPVLVNRTHAGGVEVFDDLVFHGGTGATLEMRVFSVPGILDGLRQAGFVEVEPFDRPVPEHGIVWDNGTEWPVIARAPG